MTQGVQEGVLVIDVGLTAVKAAVVGPDGRFLALGRRFWPASDRPFDLERDLSVVWPTVTGAVREAVRAMPAGTRTVAVAPTAAAQMGVCLDGAGDAFALPRPSTALPRGHGGRHPAGNGYAGVLARAVREARRTRADLVERIDRAGALHTYVLWRLSGRWASDPATGPGRLAWPRQVERSAGLPRAGLPDLLPQEAVAGPLSPAAAAAFGLPAGLPVAVGGQDGACASFGADAHRPGDCLLNLSTNFVPRLVTGRVVRGLFGYPIRPGAWAWVDGLPLGGRQADLAARALAGPGGEAALARGALDALRHGDAAPTLAYLAPPDVANQAARVGALVTAGEPPERVYLGVVEGLAAALAARVREGEAYGIRPRRYVATGGLSRQAVVTEAAERAFGAPIRLAHPEAGALGAAALAAPAAGWFVTPEAALAAWSGDSV